MTHVTARQMKALEKDAIEKHGISEKALMERAGKAVADVARSMIASGSVTVFSGYGNNGGDGFVAARYLVEKQYAVTVFLVGAERPLSEASAANLDALGEFDIVPKKVRTVTSLAAASRMIGRPGLIVDAIFGIGIRGYLDDFYLSLVDAIVLTGAPVVSVDVPSGLDADTGKPLPRAVRATKTVTFGYPKAGFREPGATEYTGEVIVADIGIPSIDPSRLVNP